LHVFTFGCWNDAQTRKHANNVLMSSDDGHDANVICNCYNLSEYGCIIDAMLRSFKLWPSPDQTETQSTILGQGTISPASQHANNI